MINRRVALATLSVATIFVSVGCTHGYGGSQAKEIAVDAKVTISRDNSGKFEFAYVAPFADSDGNFDFSKGEAFGKFVNMSFTIVDDSGLGLKFKTVATEAIWIVDKKNVGPDGSPQGPYRGTQFRDFSVSPDGKTLSLTDVNDDGVRYRYGLRFDMGAETVVDDPDTQNGSGGGHTGGN